MKMLSLISLFTAVAALVVLPVNFETAASVSFTLGFASILFSDYGRRSRQNEIRKLGPIASRIGPRSTSPLGLAA